MGEEREGWEAERRNQSGPHLQLRGQERQMVLPKGARTGSDFPHSSGFLRGLCNRSWCNSAYLPERRLLGWACEAGKGLHLHSAQAGLGRREMPPQPCCPSLSEFSPAEKQHTGPPRGDPTRHPHPHLALCTQL